MPKQISFQNLIEAIKNLHIDVPIMSVEEDSDGSLTLYLYGGTVKHWPPAAQAELVKPEPFPYTKPPVTRSELAKSKKSTRPRKVQP